MNEEDCSNPHFEYLSSLNEARTKAFHVKLWKSIPVVITVSLVVMQVLQIILLKSLALTSLSSNVMVCFISILTIAAKAGEMILPTSENLINAMKAFDDVSHVSVLAEYVTMMLHSNGRFSARDMTFLRGVLDAEAA